MIDYELTNDGNLKITATREYRRQWVEHERNDDGDAQREGWIFEYLGLVEVRPEDVGALTSAPIVCLPHEVDYPDHGGATPTGDVYWWERYAVESLSDALAKEGQAVLLRA